MAREVQLPGRYGQRGDTIQVTGMFNRACPDHGGDFDIHAERVTLLKRGGPIPHSVTPWKVSAAIALFAAAALSMVCILVKVDRRLAIRREK
jgi:hypothetical protein